MERTLTDIEHEAWVGRAGFYDDIFGEITAQVINPVLDSHGSLAGKRHLDVACGTGKLAAAAAARGALSEGVDFASTMIEKAHADFPGITFREADATALPYPDQSWDALSCSFGFSHMEDPGAAIGEAFRVLRPGGRLAFTLWFNGEGGGEFFDIFTQAFNRFGQVDHKLPERWLTLRFADQDVCARLTRLAGFEKPVFQHLPVVWRMQSVQHALDFLSLMSVRSKMMLDNQLPSAREQILAYIRSAFEARVTPHGIELPGPALLTVVEKNKE